MWAELRTLFWLQFKLTLSIFRSRRTEEKIRAVMWVLRGLTLVVTLPMFVAMGIGLAVVSVFLLTPRAAYELMMLTNNLLFFIWLLLPASYSSQIVERFELSRLFPHPIRFHSMVVGSTLMALLTMTGVWSLCLLAGEIIGLAWHRPLALPLILIGALPTFAMLVLTGRIMEDLFDLVSGDRRLRGALLALLSLPFMFCWLGQYLIQALTQNYQSMAWLERLPFLQGLERLSAVQTPSEFLEILRPSRLLIWLPTGWSTAGMGLAVTGEWGQALLFLLGSVAFVSLLLWFHAGITRRLMEGAAVGIGAERVRTRQARLRLPGPPTFWALFHKDWLYLWRSPGPRRMAFSSLLSLAAVIAPLQANPSGMWKIALPLVLGGFIVIMVSMVINMGMTSNHFGLIDREGFGTLALSPVDRRQVLLSANLVVFLMAGVLYLVVLSALALLTRYWLVLPLGLYLGLCMQVGGCAAYNLAAIIGPYRTQLKYNSGRQRGNLWGMLAWFVSSAPVLALIVLPFVFWKPGLAITLPLGAIYSVALYLVTLKPLAALLQRREHAILAAVTAQE
ncbi:MAG: hypothetical protein JW934_10495 [Anaerolineae bacterium]|nr:hypothetical protein [Anaerolineae bacterium]